MTYESIKELASYFNYDWEHLVSYSEKTANNVVDWVDNSGDLYLERIELVKQVFPNFYY